MTEHAAYLHPVLDEEFCQACGDHWPCLPHREATPPRCRCSHAKSQHRYGDSNCHLAACGCGSYRQDDTERDSWQHYARMDFYDPFPEPISYLELPR